VTELPPQAQATLRRGHLYKYKSLAGDNLAHTLEIIEQSLIYCPRPTQLNDPEECRPDFVLRDIRDPDYWPQVEAWVRRCVGHRPEPTSEEQIQTELARLTQHELEAMVAEARNEYRVEVDRRYRILSLADSPANSHLWTHYADNYAGICLRFFVNPLFGTAYRMRYSDTLPALDLTDDDGLSALNATALVKRTRWATEGEYRMIFGEPPIPGDLPLEAQKLRFAPDLLTGLLFGHRVPAAHRARLEGAFLAAPRAREVFTVTGGVPFQQLSIIRSRRT
jgi:hypothetical protein